MAPPAVGMLPMVMPDNVMVTATLAASVAAAVVMTMHFEPCISTEAILAPPETAAEGVAAAAKKPEG